MNLNASRKKNKKNTFKIYDQDSDYKYKLKIVVAFLSFFEEYDEKSKLNYNQ